MSVTACMKIGKETSIYYGLIIAERFIISYPSSLILRAELGTTSTPSIYTGNIGALMIVCLPVFHQQKCYVRTRTIKFYLSKGS